MVEDGYDPAWGREGDTLQNMAICPHCGAGNYVSPVRVTKYSGGLNMALGCAECNGWFYVSLDPFVEIVQEGES